MQPSPLKESAEESAKCSANSFFSLDRPPNALQIFDKQLNKAPLTDRSDGEAQALRTAQLADRSYGEAQTYAKRR